MKNKSSFILGLIILLISACSINSEQAEVIESTESNSSQIIITKKQFEHSGFKLGAIDSLFFSKELNANGSIHIPEKSKAIVSTYLPGTVGTINLVESQWITRGQQLFKITNPELVTIQEDFLITKENLNLLQAEYQRQETLAKENIALEKNLLDVKTKLKKAEINYSALNSRLKLYGINPEEVSISTINPTIIIKAPISGYLSAINVNKGTYLQSGEPALKIENTNQMHLGLNILEKDLSKIALGQEVHFSVQGNEDVIYKTKISLIGKTVNDDRIIMVHCEIRTKDQANLIPGMFASAKIKQTEKKMAALPIDAMVSTSGAHYVLKLISEMEDEMIFEKIKLDHFKKQNNKVSIEGINFSPNDRFLTKGAYYVVLE